jgi:hypothetical protein
MGCVAGLVTFQLGLPIRKVGERFVNQSASPVLVLMPKASMHEDNLPPARENQVGTAREGVPMQTVTISHPVNQAAHSELGAHVLAPYCPHHSAALFRRDPVHRAYRRFSDRFVSERFI